MTNPLFCIVWRLIRISTGLFLTKTAPNLTETKRHELLGLLKAGMTVQEVQKQTGVSRPTLHRILERFEETGGSLEAKKKTGRPRTKTTRESTRFFDLGQICSCCGGYQAEEQTGPGQQAGEEFA